MAKKTIEQMLIDINACLKIIKDGSASIDLSPITDTPIDSPSYQETIDTLIQEVDNIQEQLKKESCCVDVPENLYKYGKYIASQDLTGCDCEIVDPQICETCDLEGFFMQVLNDVETKVVNTQQQIIENNTYINHLIDFLTINQECLGTIVYDPINGFIDQSTGNNVTLGELLIAACNCCKGADCGPAPDANIILNFNK